MVMVVVMQHVRIMIRVTAHRATTARAPAVLITPAHVALQTVLHNVGTCKLGACNVGCKYAHAAH